MLAISTAIRTRLQALPALTGWAVRLAHEGVDRRSLPAVDVRCSGAAVTARGNSTATQLSPEWQITLAVSRTEDATELLDAALDAVIGSFHNWQPGQHGGRGWERLTLSRITEPVFEASGVVGYEMAFSTAATYHGQS